MKISEIQKHISKIKELIGEAKYEYTKMVQDGVIMEKIDGQWVVTGVVDEEIDDGPTGIL